MINQRKELIQQIHEIKDLESQFYKVPSYTKATLLIEEWKNYFNKNIKNDNLSLIDVATDKISLYSGFIEGIISEKIVKKYIKEGEDSLIEFLNKTENKLEKTFLN